MSNIGDLSKTWVLVQCGTKKFAMNYKYINSMEDFAQAKCLKTTVITGIKRGLYNIAESDMVVLDGRKLVGEKSIETIKLEYSAFIDEMKTEILNWVDSLDWAIISPSKVELDLTKFKLYKWLTNEADVKDIEIIKKRMIVPFREIFILAEDAIENKNNLEKGANYSVNISEDIKDNIDRFILKPLGRVVSMYNKDMDETCIVVNHKGMNYGLTVDNIIAVTELTDITPKYSEYKVIAGDCKYKSEVYSIFNVKYLSSLANKLNN